MSTKPPNMMFRDIKIIEAQKKPRILRKNS